jgi:hypothetical protein
MNGMRPSKHSDLKKGQLSEVSGGVIHAGPAHSEDRVVLFTTNDSEYNR